MPIYFELLKYKPIIDKNELKNRFNNYRDQDNQNNQDKPELIIDLHSPTFVGFGNYLREDKLYSNQNPDITNNQYKVRNIGSIEVQYQARPDLVMPTNPNYWWKILKYNGISNPFMIYKGMQLFLPIEQDFDANIEPNNFNLVYQDYEPEFIKQQNIESNDIKQQMKDILNQIPKPKPINKVGDKIVFGQQCLVDDPQCVIKPLSRATLKRATIKNSINNINNVNNVNNTNNTNNINNINNINNTNNTSNTI